MKWLVVKPSSFGDVLHTLPIVHRLANDPSTSSVDWVIHENLAGLLKGNPSVRRVIPFPRSRWGGMGCFLRELRRECYDQVLDLQGLLRSALIARVARAERVIGRADGREGSTFFYDWAVPVTGTHAVDRMESVLDRIKIAPCARTSYLPDTGPVRTQGLPQEFLLLHPYARWASKMLPKELAQEIVRAVAPLQVIVIGQGVAMGLDGVLDLTNQTDFPELLALMRKARCMVSSDSGPMHLADALGVPLVALFGPTAPAKTGPVSPCSTVLQMQMDCVPCFSRSCRQSVERACLRQITSDHILEKIAHVVASGAMKSG